MNVLVKELRIYGSALVLLSLSVCPIAVKAATFPDSRIGFSYVTNETQILQVIDEFSKFTGVCAKTYDVFSESITIDNTGGDIDSFLTRLAKTAELAWWYDGSCVHFERPEMVAGSAIELKGVPLDEIETEITKLGYDISSFPLILTEDEEWVYVFGPTNLVDAISEIVPSLVDQKTKTKALPTIVFGSNVTVQ